MLDIDAWEIVQHIELGGRVSIVSCSYNKGIGQTVYTLVAERKGKKIAELVGSRRMIAIKLAVANYGIWNDNKATDKDYWYDMLVMWCEQSDPVLSYWENIVKEWVIRYAVKNDTMYTSDTRKRITIPAIL